MHYFHDWKIVKTTNSYRPWPSDNYKTTVVLKKCSCGEITTTTMDGHWDLEDLINETN